MDFDDFQLRWVQFCEYVPVKFLDANNIYFGHGSYIVFVNLKTRLRRYYKALGYNNGGDVVECYSNHRELSIVAFAEKSSRPRIIFFKYPEFNVINIIKEVDSKYTSIEFAPNDFLITLSTFPDFKIRIWNWYKSEIVTTIETNYEFDHQFLTINNSIPIEFVQFSKKSKNFLQWNLCVCQSVTYLRKNSFTFDSQTILDIKICPDTNKIYLLDNNFNILSIESISFKINFEIENIPNQIIFDFIVYLNTVIITNNAKKVIIYRYQNKNWILEKEVNCTYLIERLFYNYGIIIGWDCNGSILTIDNGVIVTEFVMFIKDFELIYPDCDNFIVVNTFNQLIICSTIDSIKLGSFECFSEIVVLKSNPKFAYVLIGCSDGFIHLIKVTGFSSLAIVSTIKLLNSKINDIIYDDQGQYVVAISIESNQVFLMIQIGDSMTVLNVLKVVHQPDFLYLNKFEESLWLIVKFRHTIIKYIFNGTNFKDYVTREFKCDRSYKNIIFYQFKDNFIAIPNHGISYDIIDLINFDLIMETKSLHQMPNLNILKCNGHFVSFATDNLIILYQDNSLEKIFKKFSTVNRFDNSIKKILIDNDNRYILSFNGNILICISIHKDTCNNNERFHCVTELGVLENRLEESITWLEAFENELFDKEFLANKNLIEKIDFEFENLKKEMNQMLEINEKLDPGKKLDISQFCLNIEEQKSKNDQIERKCADIKFNSEYLIGEYERAWLWLKRNCWDKCVYKKRILKGCYSKIAVENYPILSDKISKRIQENFHKMEIIQNTGTICYFDKFWINNVSAESKKEFLEFFMGTKVNTFLENRLSYYHQFEINTVFQKNFMSLLFQLDNHKLRLQFNEKFEIVIKEKSKVMDQVKTWNSRIRHILTELNQDITSVVDPKWENGEDENDIITIKNSEIRLKSANYKKQIKEVDVLEDQKLLLAIEDFKDQALEKMMHGVLEIRWEDEIKKDIPLPKCMIEKNPDEYNEEDYQEILLYEEKVQQLEAARLQYKNMLIDEYEKLSNKVISYVGAFNDKIGNLAFFKTKIESTILQHDLFTYRWALLEDYHKGLLWEQREILNKIEETDEDIKSLQTHVFNFFKEVDTCTELNKKILGQEKILDRKIKKEFGNLLSTFQEQIYKLYKKTPKISLKLMQSQCLLENLANSIVSNEGQENNVYLNTISLDYLNTLTGFDNALQTMKFLNESSAKVLSTYRRKRLEIDIQSKKVLLDKFYGEQSMKFLQETLAEKKKFKEILEDDLNSIKKKIINNMIDMQIQVILKQGSVECSMSGKIDDFDDVMIINRYEVIKLNQLIIQEGKLKMKAFKKALNLCRILSEKKWDHEYCKMLLVDVNYDLVTVENTQINKDVEEYINLKRHTINEKRFRSIEEEELNLESEQINVMNKIQREINDFQGKISDMIASNKRLDSEITKLNFNYSEQLLNAAEEERSNSDSFKLTDTQKLTMIQKRRKLMKKIETQYEILIELKGKIENLTKMTPIQKF